MNRHAPRLRRNSRWGSIALVPALIAALLVSAPSSWAIPSDRVAGESRLDTAVAISRRAFPQGAPGVFLARADVFADALAAGTLTGGPVLLVPSCGAVPPAVAQEIARLDPETVTALGGQAALCDELLTAAAGGRPTQRLSGASRIDTAVQISRAQFPQGAGAVYLAREADSPDAVAAGSLTGGPILLVPSTGPVPVAVLEEIARLDPTRVVALGGVNAVSDEVLAEAAGIIESARVAGPSRIDTAAAIAAYQFGLHSPGGGQAGTVYLARADVFADAVAAGALTDGPTLLVPSCGPVPPPVLAEIARLQPASVVALGGTAAVCDALLAEAAGVPPAPQQIGENTRVLGPADREALEAFDPDGTLRFGPGASGVAALAPGDVVVSEPTTAAPDGLLRRVVDVRQENGAVVVVTEPAALTDAIENGSGTLSAPLDFADLESSEVLLDGVTVGPAPAPGLALQAAETGISLGFAEEVVLGEGATVSGSVQLGLTLQASVEVGFFRLKRFDAGVEASQSSALNARVAGSASYNNEIPVWRGRFRPFILPVAGVPVVVRPTVTVALRGDGSASTTISWDATQSASYRAGIRYTDGDWDTYQSKDFDFSSRPPVLEGDANAKVAARADLGVAIYGIEGLSLTAEAYVTAEAHLATQQELLLKAGLNVGAGVHLVVPVLGEIADEDFTLFAYERELLRLPEPGQGDVQATLIWTGDSDMDLHVVEPSGEEIFFANPASATGGQLDIDDIPPCGDTGRHVENIFWPADGAPAGDYAAFVHHFNSCGGDSNYVLEVRVDGQLVQRDAGTLAPQAESPRLAFSSG